MARQVTLKDVAEKAEVSYQTVSKVLNHMSNASPETEKRIWAAAKELGYQTNHSARSLRLQRSKTIGYSWEPSPQDESNPILDEFLQSMFRTAESLGYYMLCFPYHSDAERQINAYRSLIDTGRVDGFVLSTVTYGDPCVDFLSKRKFPFYAFGRAVGDQNFPWLDVDGGAGISLAVEHLYALGHRRIAALAWPQISRVGNHRMEGYYASLTKLGLPLADNLIHRGAGTYQVGQEGVAKLMELPESERPTAIVCMNDLMAFGAMAGLAMRGLVPGKDVGLVGFDDTPTARLIVPGLTSLRQPIYQIGTRLMERLIANIETGKLLEPAHELFQPQLIVRESTAHPGRASFVNSSKEGLFQGN